MQYLKQSTASQSVKLGPFVDSTDGVTAETALSIANTDIKLSANGGTMASKNSGGGTHDANGWYTITLDATDTATVGRLQVSCAVSGALPVFAEFQVLEEAIYDALFAASATGALPATLVQGGINTTSGTITTLDGLDTAQDSQHSTTQSAISGLNDIAATDIVSGGAITTSSGAVSNVTTVATCTTNTDMRGTDSAALATALATAQADLDTITGSDGVTLATAQGNYTPATASDVSTALSTYDGPTKGEMDAAFAALNDLSAAEVNAEVDTALADIHLDHLLAVDYDPASKPGTSTALLNELIESDAGVSRFTANALEQAPSGGGTVDANIVSVLGTSVTETASGYLAAGFSYWFDVATPAKTINDAGVAGAGLSAEDVWTYGTRVLTANTNLNDPTAAAIADAVLDEALAGHTTNGTVGDALGEIVGWDGNTPQDLVDGQAAILVQVGLKATAAALATAQADLGTITGSDGVTLATTQANYAPAKATDIVSGGAITTSGGAVSTVTTVGTCTTNTDMRGTDSAATASALATAQADLDTITGSDGVTLATTQSNYAPAKAGDAMALTSSERSTVAGVIHTTAMTESYGTDGSALTLAQACYLILGGVSEFAISGTTKTVKQLDGSTTAATYTLDDASNPTSITRAS